jgi:hypothetical protein
MQAYMSPYMQNVVDIQQREAQRQADIARTGRGAQAVRAGAFGGSRQAIMEAEAGRNLQQQLGDIQARGLQSAFDRAQQAQQFGAELGLRGYGQAGQLAQTLGGLGATQFGQQKDIISMQAAAGKERQALEQQRLSQQYQDFLRQQQFPYQQLGFFSDMLRGTPVGQTATTIYNQPQESLLPSLIGAGGAFMSSKYGPFAAHGGEIKYAAGQSVVNPLRSLGEMYDSPGMSAEQLKEIIANPKQSDPVKAQAMQLLGIMQTAEREQQAAATQQVLMDDMARGPARGLDDAAAMSPEIDAMYSDDPAMMSRGGLTSFQVGGITLGEEYDAGVAPDAGSFWKGLNFSFGEAERRAQEASRERLLGTPPMVPQDPATTPTADDYMVTGEGSARVAAENAAAAKAGIGAAPVSTEVAGLSALQQRQQQLMDDMRKQQADMDSEALVTPEEEKRKWWFNFFANVAKTKTTRGGVGAALEGLANGFAAMPAYEAQQERIEREQRRLRNERNMTLNKLELAMNQGQQQQAIQLQELANNQSYRMKALEAQAARNATALAKLVQDNAYNAARLGIDANKANAEIASKRAEAAITIDRENRGRLEDYQNRFGDEEGLKMYNDWRNAILDKQYTLIRLDGSSSTGQSTVKKATDLLAAAPQK